MSGKKKTRKKGKETRPTPSETRREGQGTLFDLAAEKMLGRMQEEPAEKSKREAAAETFEGADPTEAPADADATEGSAGDDPTDGSADADPTEASAGDATTDSSPGDATTDSSPGDAAPEASAGDATTEGTAGDAKTDSSAGADPTEPFEGDATAASSERPMAGTAGSSEPVVVDFVRAAVVSKEVDPEAEADGDDVSWDEDELAEDEGLDEEGMLFEEEDGEWAEEEGEGKEREKEGRSGASAAVPHYPTSRSEREARAPRACEREPRRSGDGEAAAGESPFARALRLQRGGRMHESRKLYEEILADEPGHLGALTNLGILAFMQERFDEALCRFEEVERLDGESADGPYNAAKALRGMGRITEAMERFERAHRLVPRDVQTAYELGRCYLDMDRPEKTLEFVDACKERFVGVKEMILLQAEALLCTGDFDGCVDLLKPVLRDDPGCHRAYALVAEAHFHAQRTDKAVTSVKRALLVAPDEAEYHKRLGIYYAYRGDGALAREEFATARSLDPTIPLRMDGDAGGGDEGSLEHWDRLKFENYILGRSRFYAKTGKWRGAVNEFLILSQKHPGQSIIWQELGAAYQNTGEHKRAQKMYERAHRIDPENLEVQLQLARIALELNDLAQARRCNDETLRRYESVAEVHLLRGQIRLAAGEVDEARRAYERVLELEPSMVDGMVGLGICLRRLGDEERAREHLAKAHRIAPSRLDALEALADLHRRAGRWSEARELLVEGQKHHPESISIHAALAEVHLAQGRIESARQAYQAITGTRAADWSEAVALARSMMVSRKFKDALRVVKHLLRQKGNDPELHGLEAIIHACSHGEVKFWIPWQRAWREDETVFDRLGCFVELVCSERDLLFLRKQMKRTRTLFASFPEIFDRVIAFEERLVKLTPSEPRGEQSA